MKQFQLLCKRGISIYLCLSLVLSMGAIPSVHAAEIDKPKQAGSRQVEDLDRGVIAIKTAEGVYLSWRYLRSEEHTSELQSPA